MVSSRLSVLWTPQQFIGWITHLRYSEMFSTFAVAVSCRVPWLRWKPVLSVSMCFQGARKVNPPKKWINQGGRERVFSLVSEGRNPSPLKKGVSGWWGTVLVVPDSNTCGRPLLSVLLLGRAFTFSFQTTCLISLLSKFQVARRRS